MERIILTMKWGDAFTCEDVNVLFNAAAANLTGEARFLCLTDDPHGLADYIEHRPIPETDTDPRIWAKGAWPKLSVFTDELEGLSGRAIYLDIDTVICGPLDEMFEVQGPLICLDSRPWRYKEGPARTGTGVFAFDIGNNAAIWKHFHTEKEMALATYSNEQDFLHGEFEKVIGASISYWPDPWIRSFKYHQRQKLGLDRIWGPKPPEPPAKILCFHGKPRPKALIRPPKGNWDVFPHYGRGPVKWMQDYWTRFGGKL